jgi:zinc and cadmium transporter
MVATWYALGSVVIVSVCSIIAAIPLLFKKKVPQHLLMFLLSLSVGSLLGSVFIHFLPEAVSEKYTLGIAINLIIGFLSFFLLEKFVHWHHNKKCEHGECGHGHAYHLAPINLIGDGVHNFIDGMVIAGAYAASIPVGIAATISIIFHELPQEIADFGVLLYTGMSKKRAILFNFLSATTAILGAIVGLFLASRVNSFAKFILPFAAGSFLYIAASNLVPELHRHCKLWDTILHILAICLGVGIMAAITLFAPHVH